MTEADMKFYRNAALSVYNHLRNLVARLGKEGWRPYFCWGSATIVLFALKVAFVDLPSRNIVLPDSYYGSLLLLLGSIIAVLGLRGAEKAVERQQVGMPGGGLVNPHALENSNAS